jgi:hypothetical protein
MMSDKYNPEHETILNKIMQDMPQTNAGRMFGYPGYKVNGKLAAGLHEQGIIVKVGHDRASEIIGQGQGQAFEPMAGRVWRDWVLLTTDFDKHKALFKEAVAWVTKETG